VLARIYAAFEDFPAAITSYNRGIEVRPDRADLLEMRTSLEERLLRFDDAALGYAKLYDLTYKDPRWMLKVAEMHARRGRKAEVVKALEQALVEGQPPRPANFIEASRRLEGWGFPEDALRYTERCPEENWWEDGVLVECASNRLRLLVRLRKTGQAIDWLTRSSAPEDSATGALKQMGEAAATYFAPEERAALVTLIEASPLALPSRVTLAEAAQLAELEAKIRHELVMTGPADDREDQMNRLIALQNSRLRFSELGSQLEAFWKSRPRAENHDRWLAEAAVAYRRAGDAAAELRVRGILFPRGMADTGDPGRYWALLRQRDPQRLLQLAARNPDAVKAAIEGDDAALAERTVAARGAAISPVWTRAYTALSGLHFRRETPAVRTAFAQALGGGMIGERIGRPVDRKNQLAGDIWYYYAFRHAEYLSLTRQPLDDIAPAWVEGRPGSADAYVALGDFYFDAGNRERAIAEYDRALTLNERIGKAHDRSAALLWEMSRRDDATTRWRAAITAFSATLDQRNLPDSFWTDLGAMFDNLRSRGLTEGLRSELSPLLDKYVRRHSSYRLNDLLGSYISASPAQGAAWIADLSRRASDAAGFLNPLIEASWIPQAARDPLFQRALELAEQRVAQSFGDARENTTAELRVLKTRWIRHLLDTQRTSEAQSVLSTFADADRRSIPYALVPLDVLVAARNKTVDSLIARWRANPDDAPELEQVRDAAATLNRSGERPAANALLEYYHWRALDMHDYSPSHFLGLAEIVASRDPATAVSLLRRMVLLTPAPFESLRPAASLLDRLNRPAEAGQFLEMAAQVAPWDWDARDALAERRKDANEMKSVAASQDTPYSIRVRAAHLQSAPIDPESFHGKLNSAESTQIPAERVRLWREAIAMQPRLAPESLRWWLSAEAFRAGDVTLAVSAVELTLEAAGWRSIARSLEFRPGVEVVERPMASAGTTNAMRARAAATLAEAMRRLGRLNDARALFTAADRLSPGTAKAGLDSVTAEINRRAQNAARAPVVTTNLDQPHLVRPRLVAAAQGGAR
jgi:tetratricopeptide (TPR) repeat protein